MSAFKQRLRTPMGQVQLMGATLLGAGLFAAFLGTQQAFFESYIVEKPAPVDAALERLVDQLEAEEEVALDAKDRARLYELWIQAEEPPSAAVVAAIAADETWLCERVERSLVAGNIAQRLAAVDLAQRASRCDAVLTAARDRASRMGPPKLFEALSGG